MKYIFVLLFAFTGAFGFILHDRLSPCQLKRILTCSQPFYPQDLYTVIMNMTALCTFTPQIVKCLRDAPECETVDPYANEINYVKGFEKIFSIFCADEYSYIKKAYLENEKCVLGYFEQLGFPCCLQGSSQCKITDLFTSCAYQKSLACNKMLIHNKCGKKAASVYAKIGIEVMCAAMNNESLNCHDPTCFMDAIYREDFTECKQQLESCTKTRFGGIPAFLYRDMKATCRTKYHTLKCVEESPACKAIDSADGILNRGFQKFYKTFCNSDLTLKREYQVLNRCLQPFDIVEACLDTISKDDFYEPIEECSTNPRDLFNDCLVKKVAPSCGTETAKEAIDTYLQISCAFAR